MLVLLVLSAIGFVVVRRLNGNESAKWVESLNFGSAREVEGMTTDRLGGANVFVRVSGDLSADEVVSRLQLPAGYRFDPWDSSQQHDVTHPTLGRVPEANLGMISPKDGQPCSGLLSVIVDSTGNNETHLVVSASCGK